MDRRQAPAVEVWIEDQRWRPVDRLDEAGPDEPVFAFDSATGTIRFGDGLRGRVPRAGTSVRVGYRAGGGPGSNHAVSAWFEARWPLDDLTVALTTSRDGTMTVRLQHGEAGTDASLKRVRYFHGQVLGTQDFQAEQDYFRTRLRRRNLALHGSGVIGGLDITAAQRSWKDPWRVTVSPGAAIAPDGEEIVVPAETTCVVSASSRSWYVVLRLVSREADVVPVPGDPSDPEAGMQASRVEESYAVALETSPGPNDVQLGRLIASDAGWAIDSQFRPPRAR